MRQNRINSIGDIKQEKLKKTFNSDKKEGSIDMLLNQMEDERVNILHEIKQIIH